MNRTRVPCEKENRQDLPGDPEGLALSGSRTVLFVHARKPDKRQAWGYGIVVRDLRLAIFSDRRRYDR